MKAQMLTKVKRARCVDCCHYEFEKRTGTINKDICPQAEFESLSFSRERERIYEYMNRNYKKNNACRFFPLLHFDLDNHNYRPAFMVLKRARNGKYWIHYDCDAEKQYDSEYHVSCRNVDWQVEFGDHPAWGGYGGLD